MKYKSLLSHNSKLSTFYFILIFLLIFTVSVVKFFVQKYYNEDGVIYQSEGVERDKVLSQHMIEQEVTANRSIKIKRDGQGEFIIDSGDTLASIFEQAEITSKDSHNIITAIKKVYNPKNLRIGNIITINYNPQAMVEDNYIVDKIIIRLNALKSIELLREERGYKAKLVEVPVIRHVAKRNSVIKNSFIDTASKLSIPHHSILGLVKAYSHDVDFQRDIKYGDKLQVLIERFYTSEGQYSHNGDVLYSSLNIKGKKLDIYKYINKNGEQNYYTKDGQSIHKTLLRTPVNAAKISSKFGMRKHPVLGFSRMHKGLDFSAAIGTPIFAAGSGEIVEIGRKGGYGNYIKIRHNEVYSTAYGHISKFGNGIKKGKRVTQGQTIAYVGKTGISTGPHLHYEVHKNGVQVNPHEIKGAFSGGKLQGKDLLSFKEVVNKINNILKTTEEKDVKF
jgi:murein DD-endopeptidase MepM/ murein hydrolase activator NlpD